MKSTHPPHDAEAKPSGRLKLIQTKVPPAMLTAVDDAVAKLDTDRSKFVRQAIRRHLASQAATA